MGMWAWAMNDLDHGTDMPRFPGFIFGWVGMG
jgi:hypothetical protein